MGRPSTKIGSIVRATPVGTVVIRRKLGARDVADITLLDLDSGFRPTVGQTIEILDGTTTIWTGLISSYTEKSLSDGKTTFRTHALACIGWEHRLDRRLVYDPATGLSKTYSRNYLFTADPVTDILTAPGHGRTNGDLVQVKTSANGTLPWHLVSNTNYYVRDVSGDTLKLAATLGGPAIDLTDAGDGRHMLITYRAGEIASALLTTYAGDEGISEAEIELGAVVDKVVFDGVSVAEAIKNLADLSGLIFWVDKDLGFHFVSRSANPAPFSLTDNSRNFSRLEVTRTIEAKINDVLMRVNWNQFPVTEEIFEGDGATRDWELTKPAAVVSYTRTYGAVDEVAFTVDVGTDVLTAAGNTTVEGQRVRVRSTGALPAPLAADTDYYARDVSGDNLKLAYYPDGLAIDVTDAGTGTHYLIVYRPEGWYESAFGVDGQDIDKDFYWDPGLTTIRQDASQPMLGVTARLAVGYWPLGSNLVNYEDTGSIAATVIAEGGGSGRYTKVMDRLDTGEGQIQALNYGVAVVNEHKEVGIDIRYTTSLLVEPSAIGLTPGQLQSVDLTDFDVDEGFLIDEVTITDKETYFEYTVHALNHTYYADWLDYYRAWVGGGAANISLTGGAAGGGLGGGGGEVPPGGVLKVEMTLTAPSTEVVCPYDPAEGVFLVVYLTQDATGGREATWPAAFNIPVTNLDPDPDTTSAFAFIARADHKWWPFAPPITKVITI